MIVKVNVSVRATYLVYIYDVTFLLTYELHQGHKKTYTQLL